MAVDLDGGTGLFDRIGRLTHVLNQMQVWHGTTLPAELEDALEEYDGANTTIRATVVRTPWVLAVMAEIMLTTRTPLNRSARRPKDMSRNNKESIWS